MTNRSAQQKALFSVVVAPHVTRKVWAAVTETPSASVRELGERTNMRYTAVAAAIRHLEWLGYLERAGPRSARARRILVPFMVLRRTDQHDHH